MTMLLTLRNDDDDFKRVIGNEDNIVVELPRTHDECEIVFALAKKLILPEQRQWVFSLDTFYDRYDEWLECNFQPDLCIVLTNFGELMIAKPSFSLNLLDCLTTGITTHCLSQTAKSANDIKEDILSATLVLSIH